MSGDARDGAGAASGQTDDSPEPGDELKPMGFDIFVLSLNASALIHLGEASDAPGVTSVNLPLARQTIDILGMLETKTRGNLSGEEERLLHDVLFDLRMRYTRHAQRAASATK